MGRCRTTVSPRAPRWHIDARATKIGTIDLPSSYGPQLVTTWRVVERIPNSLSASDNQWFLADRTVLAAQPHEDVLQMLFAARSPTGPWEQGRISVSAFGVGIGDIPGEWVTRRVMKTTAGVVPVEVFAMPEECERAVPWQNGGV